MKKFSKIFCIIAAVAVMVACFAIPASAASMQEPDFPVNAEVGESLLSGWYMFPPSGIGTSDSVSLEGEFIFEVQGVKYSGRHMELNADYPYLEYWTSVDSIIRVYTDEGWFFPEARIFYIEYMMPTEQVQADFINSNFFYIGDSLVVDGAEPEGWYNNIYDLVVTHIFGGEINLTPGMEFSASLVATVISIVAFLLPILICVFIIRFLFAWRM